MKRRLIVTVILAAILCFNNILVQANASYIDVKIYTEEEIAEINAKVKSSSQRIAAAKQMDEGAKKLGYGYDNDIRVLARKELAEAQAEYDIFIVQQEEAKWSPMLQEYPVATVIWKYLIECGYSEVVAAAILGNIMAETGGNTLDIDYTTGNGEFYGICQWKKTYCKDVFNKDLQEQLAYLSNTVEQEFNTFGNRYKSNFDYDDFLAMTDVWQAALAFAKCYERCESSNYSVRETNAEAALEYFAA